MNYIFYQTKTKFSNTGDALINHSLIQILRNFGVLRANCSKDIPDEFIDQLGIAPTEKIIVSNEFLFAIHVMWYALKSKKTRDRIYIFSGLGHTYGSSLKKIARNVIAGILFPFYRLLGVSIVRIGLSLGPISKALATTELIRSYFISHYLVRDSKSLELCHKIGIKKARLCPDMSWLYQTTAEKKTNKSNIIIVNLRNSTLDEFIYPDYIESLIQKCIAILENIQKSDNRIIKVIITYQVMGDKDFSHELYNKLKSQFNVELIDKQMSLKDVEKYYGQASFNISNRMHSLLLGYKFGALPLALIDLQEHIKISATFNDNGLSDLLIDIKKEKNIDDQIKHIYNNKDFFFEKIIECEQKKQSEIISILKSII